MVGPHLGPLLSSGAVRDVTCGTPEPRAIERVEPTLQPHRACLHGTPMDPQQLPFICQVSV